MGFIEAEERRRVEVEEFKRMVLQAVAIRGGRKDDDDDDDEFTGLRSSPVATGLMEDDGEEKVVCITSGVSYLGIAIVNRLLSLGYSVRIMVDDEEDIEKLRELETTSSCDRIKAVTARVSDIESLAVAFQGCRGVFHTSAFTDPAGLSGYTKSMVDIEERASENVMMACSRTPSVRKCVLTSSLLTCLWRDGSSQDLSPVINHESWSDESFCIDKKLWYALGKLRAEKAAWRIANDKGLKLATLCPGLVTGPEVLERNSTATIAYLKGAPEMLAYKLLATVDVMKLAEAHACVYEAMNKTAFGRYICFDTVIQTENDAEKLTKQIGIPTNKLTEGTSNHNRSEYKIWNGKILNLMSRSLRRCNSES